jgi:endoglucanase
LVVKTAKAKKIPYQIEADPRGTGTDANVIQISRSGVAAGLISVPNRYMHTQVETASLTDLDNCASLLTETVTRITTRMSFIPK